MNNTIKKASSPWLNWIVLVVLIYQPIADFVAYNYFQASFSLLRCLIYYLSLILCASVVIAIGKKLLGKERGLHLTLSVGFAILVLLNNYAIQSSMQDMLGDAYRFRYLITADFIIITLFYFVSSFICKIKPFLYAFISTIFIFSTINLVSAKHPLVNYDELNVKEYTDLVSVPKTTLEGAPNVYFLIPDGFSGSEIFNKLAQNKLTINESLEQKGFKVVRNAYSNGSATLLSLPQVYSMNYLFKEGEVISGKKIEELGRLYQEESPVTREFRRRGYKFYRLVDGMSGHCIGTEDVCIQKKSLFNTQDVTFFNRTLVPSALAHKLWWSKGLIPGMMEMNEFIPLLPDVSAGPFFMIGHFALPHNPFRFDKECNSLGYSSVFSSTQAYFDKKPGKERYGIYEGQTLCAQKLLLKLVEGIKAKDPHAIIVIQADHGSQDYFDPYSQNYEDLKIDNFYEAFNILYAFYGPESLTHYVYDGFSPINTFRLIFGWLDKMDPELLEHRAFYGSINKKTLEETGGIYVMHEWLDAPVPNKASRS